MKVQQTKRAGAAEAVLRGTLTTVHAETQEDPTPDCSSRTETREATRSPSQGKGGRNRDWGGNKKIAEKIRRLRGVALLCFVLFL